MYVFFMHFFNLSWWQGVPLCSACHIHFPRKDRKTCQKCADAWTEKLKEKKAQQLCYACSRKAAPGFTYCPECMDRRKAIELPRIEGICSTCNKQPVEEGRKSCSTCTRRFKVHYDECVRLGVCTQCSSPLSEFAQKNKQRRCVACRAKSREYFADRRENLLIEGKCWTHPARNATATDRTRCEECVAAHSKRAKERYDRLRAKGKCVVCGKRPPVEGTVRCAVDQASAKATANRVRLRTRDSVGDNRTKYEKHLRKDAEDEDIENEFGDEVEGYDEDDVSSQEKDE